MKTKLNVFSMSATMNEITMSTIKQEKKTPNHA
jgi:hypothetical protein